MEPKARVAELNVQHRKQEQAANHRGMHREFTKAAAIAVGAATGTVASDWPGLALSACSE